MKGFINAGADSQTLGPSYARLYQSTGVKSAHLTYFLPMAVNSPCYFHTILALAQMYRMRLRGGVPTKDPVIMFHRGKTFQYLQQSLTDIEDDAVIMSIVLWIFLDVSRSLRMNAPLIFRGG
jgi:hypothetical protein